MRKSGISINERDWQLFAGNILYRRDIVIIVKSIIFIDINY